jgi:hypothetical protein
MIYNPEEVSFAGINRDLDAERVLFKRRPSLPLQYCLRG